MNMTTTPSIDSAVAELRAFLTLDMDLYRRLHDAQDADGRRAFTAVLTIAFTRAAERRFGEQPSPEDIINFVSDARARTVGPDSGSPEDAEKVLRGALGEEELLSDVDIRARAAAQNAMLFAITHENDDAPAQIDGLLTQAAEEAEAYFRRRAAR
jgi:hypothetical protein